MRGRFFRTKFRRRPGFGARGGELGILGGGDEACGRAGEEEVGGGVEEEEGVSD